MIKWSKRFRCLALALSLLTLTATAYAAEEIGDVDDKRIKSADDWFAKNSTEYDPNYRWIGDEMYTDSEGAEKPKYVWLMDDNSYRYYVDAENLQWKRVPYRIDDYMLDTWVLLSSRDLTVKDHYPGKYFLEHYYIWPKQRKVQFLCELEVHDRPQNAISERPYDAKRWENLVPGSMEDRIYSRLMKRIKDDEICGSSPPHDSFRDMLEEYLRISL